MNLFNSKLFVVTVILVLLSIGGDKKIQKIMNNFDLNARDVLEIATALGVIGGAGASRYLGDKDCYTPKGLPGRDKIVDLFFDDDDDEPEVNL